MESVKQWQAQQARVEAQEAKWADWVKAMKECISVIDLELDNLGFLEDGEATTEEYKASPWYWVGRVLSLIEMYFPEIRRDIEECTEEEVIHAG
jgi:hypothetical protein